MIRRLTVSVALMSCLIGIGVAQASSAQWQGDLTQRVGTLENQVRASGNPIPPMPIAQEPQRMQLAQSSGDLAVRVDRLETQMRQYTGQIEELNFRIRQLTEQLQRFQEDSEFRFRDLEGGTSAPRAPSNQSGSLSGNQSGAASGAAAGAASGGQASSQQFDQLGSPPQNLGTLSQNGSGDSFGSGDGPIIVQPGSGGAPIDLSSMLGGGTTLSSPGSGGMSQPASLTGDPATDYDRAYGFVLQGDYPQAEQAFRQFVQSYGQSDLAPNAQYWIGESLYQQGQFRDSIEVFLDAYSQYPNSQKAPDMLLKTGMALHQINERDAACATYEELLNKFPNASSGVRQKVNAELQSAKC